jgi:hypothetical protein
MLPGDGSNGSSNAHCASIIEYGYTGHRRGAVDDSPWAGHDKHKQADDTDIELLVIVASTTIDLPGVLHVQTSPTPGHPKDLKHSLSLRGCRSNPYPALQNHDVSSWFSRYYSAE